MQRSCCWKLWVWVNAGDAGLYVCAGHDFHIDQPYCHVFDLVRVVGLNARETRVKLLVRRFWQMANDSCKTTLWLQFSARKLAVAIFILCARYSGVRIDLHKMWSYYNDNCDSPSDHRSEIKRIWTQLLPEYDPKCRIHQHANIVNDSL